jgi:adenine deaminase
LSLPVIPGMKLTELDLVDVPEFRIIHFEAP